MKNKESTFLGIMDKQRLLERFIQLLKIKSPSRNEKEIINYISKILNVLEIGTKVDSSGTKFGSNT